MIKYKDEIFSLKKLKTFSKYLKNGLMNNTKDNKKNEKKFKIFIFDY